MSNDTPGAYPENVAEAAALDVIARFAVAQEEAGGALHALLTARLPDDVVTLLWRGGRLTDEDRLVAVIALAQTTGYPLHEHAYRDTYRAVKALRDQLAHGGPPMRAQDSQTAEPILWTFSASKKNPRESQMHTHSLAEVRAVAADARWLGVVAWRIRELIEESGMPSSVLEPSDIPPSAVSDVPANRDGWGAPPVCPRGHADVYGVSTRYGDAWLCGHCSHVRLRDESALIGSRETLRVDDRRGPHDVAGSA